MLLKLYTFLQSIYQPTCALHIQFMTKIILLHVLAMGCHRQAALYNKGQVHCSVLD